MEPLDRQARRQLIAEYVRERVQTEVGDARGKKIALANGAGISPSHLSSVLYSTRGVGDSVALALARYWGMTYEQLEEAAREARSRRAEQEAAALISEHPNLASTIQWCRESYPQAYLEAYLRYARLLPHDRPREVWLQDIQVQYWDWKKGGRIGYQLVNPTEADDADAASTAEPQKKLGRPRMPRKPDGTIDYDRAEIERAKARENDPAEHEAEAPSPKPVPVAAARAAVAPAADVASAPAQKPARRMR